MASRRVLAKRHLSTQTYRQRVLDVIDRENRPLTGHEIAQLTDLTYRQTIDALNALFNMEKIARTGRKFTARWGKLVESEAKENPALLLARIFANMRRL
jgi:hypothetical protein